MSDVQYYVDNDTMCSICYAEFLDIDDLKLHMIQYHLTNTNKNRFCKLCSIIYASVDDFALHIRNEHLIDLKSCKYCSKMYINVNTLLEHEKRHKSQDLLKLLCSQCEASFNNSSDLENHEYDNHKDGDDGVMLQHCFASLSALINMNIKRFLEVYHRDCLYVCAICDMSTPECSLYIQHLKKGKCKSYACNECFNVYAMKRSLREHCGRHLQAKNLKYSKYKKQCLKCSKYYTAYELKKHLKECNIIRCRQCPLRFDSVSALANHITVHSQKVPAKFVSCKYCRKPVIGTNALEKHIERTHKHNLHLYKYSCVHCDIAFKHPKLLFGHFYTKHKDIQPYTCRICSKVFRLRKKFTLHIKLDHKSVGFVEFDEKFHVHFTDKKSIDNENNLKMKDNSANNLDLMKKSNLEDQDKEQSYLPDKVTDEQSLNNNEKLVKENISTDIVGTSRTENVDNITTITIDDTEECENSSKTEDVHDNSISEENKTETVEDKVDSEEKRESLEELVFENIEILEPELIESDSDSRLLMIRKKRKYTKNRKSKNGSRVNLDDSSDDSDIPLLELVKEKSRKKEKRGRPKAPWNKCPARTPKSKKFMCLKCNINCYTYQNYDRHMNMHKKNKNKSCIKCVKQFKTTEDLVYHIKTEHATSKLTETLKKMLDQRKKDEHEIYVSEKFVQTMHKVPVVKNVSPATITRVNNRLSVKKFWENFTPDSDSKKDAKISIKEVSEKRTEPFIKLTKFTPELPTQEPKLKMPVKYTDGDAEHYNVSIKLVHCDLAPSALNFHNEITITDINYNELETQNNKDIPEIAHEIMLVETEVKNVKYIKKTVILKDLLRYNNVKIGHLAPQAPFFKIVSIDDVLQEEKTQEPITPDKLVLPNGTKLVNVNPLAHLLNKKDIKEICKTSLKSKSTAKVQNFSEAIVKAMTVLDKPVKKRFKRVESVDPIEIE